jgi:preprotein translocase subunit SecE
MAMNRETKRRLQKQGAIDEDGLQKATRRPAPSPTAPREPRTKPREFVREVNAEMRKVAWPSRQETINLSVIVLIFLVLLTAFIAGLDVGFSKAVLWIVDQ